MISYSLYPHSWAFPCASHHRSIGARPLCPPFRLQYQHATRNSCVPASHHVSIRNFVKTSHINRCIVFVDERNALPSLCSAMAAAGVMLPDETPLQRLPTEARSTPQHQPYNAPHDYPNRSLPQALTSVRLEIKHFATLRVRYGFMALRACLIERPVRSSRNSTGKRTAWMYA
jgi:hypothetical protein